MRSEYLANNALASTPSHCHHRQTPNVSRMARAPEPRTFWGLIFFWL